ncbi:hypothetical protein MGN70_004072 [Eutypa lata]|nr:hypothetical protein MGN70_004072 [Eutypa lata]
MSFSSSSTFCEKCRAVLFDDSAVEGYVAQGADDDQEFLRIKGYYYERCFDKKIIPINYDVEDSYPDLIFLSTSAAAGCKFCDFLRTMALEPKLQKKSSEAGIDITRADKVQIRMQYLWKVDPLETPTANGLCALQLVFCFNADVLCIIQDDPIDWQRESALIGKVYSNAYLTICNLSSESCTQGFLERPPAQIEIPFQSKIRPEIRGSFRLPPWGTIYSNRTFYDHSKLQEDISYSKLETRGWAFQERAMSRRILAFGRSRIHFICPEYYQTQGDEPVNTRSILFQTGHLEHSAGNSGKGMDYYKFWYERVIPEYSTRSLTYKKDCFPALSGIAQYFASLLSDEYVAGLWREELHRGLFWCCVGTGKKWDALLDQLGDESTAYLAPSWSWASRGGYKGFDIRWFYMHEEKYHKVRKEYKSIEINIDTVGADSFGQLKAVSLQIMTKVIPLPGDMEREDNGWDSRVVGDQDMSLASTKPDWYPSFMEPRREMQMLLLGSARLPPISWSSSNSDTDVSDDEAAVIEFPQENGCDWVYGLLIHPTRPGANTFFRVGLFHSASWPGWGPHLFNDVPETTIVLV